MKCAHSLCNNADVDWDNLRVFLTIARTGRVSALPAVGVEHTTVSPARVLEEGAWRSALLPDHRCYSAQGKNVVANAETMERAAIAVAGRARAGAARCRQVRLALALSSRPTGSRPNSHLPGETSAHS
jgi:hypothetical protein